MMYYFAYGSNMCHKQMDSRCPGSVFVTRVSLKDYCFVYDGRSKTRRGPVANVINSPGDSVWGGLFEITAEHRDALDKCEGYPHSYGREEMDVEDEEGKVYRAEVYFRQSKDPGEPTAEYRSILAKGAADCGLDKEYIRDVINA